MLSKQTKDTLCKLALVATTGAVLLHTDAAFAQAVGGGGALFSSGTNFLSGATVTFGGFASSNVVVASGTTIIATTPVVAAPGVVDVVVTTYTATAVSAADHFTYVATAPTITSVYPPSGAPGGSTPVTITGTGFTFCRRKGTMLSRRTPGLRFSERKSIPMEPSLTRE